MKGQKLATENSRIDAVGVCAPDAVCLLLGCKPESGRMQCNRYTEASGLRKDLKRRGHIIGETYIRCKKCKGVNGHNGDCENRFGIRINTLANNLCPQLGLCPATKVQKPLLMDECTSEAYKSCSFYQV